MVLDLRKTLEMLLSMRQLSEQETVHASPHESERRNKLCYFRQMIASTRLVFFIDEYWQFLTGKFEGTMEAYLRTARHLVGWVATRSGNDGYFQPRQLTKEVVEQEGFSLHHRARVKSIISNFARFLIGEKGLRWPAPRDSA
jgi:hypothetical protein